MQQARRLEPCRRCGDRVSKDRLKHHTTNKCRRRLIVCNVCWTPFSLEYYSRVHRVECLNQFRQDYRRRIDQHLRLLMGYIAENTAKIILNYLIRQDCQSMAYRIAVGG